MNHPNRFLFAAPLFACLLLANCRPGGDNANHANAKSDAANVENRAAPVGGGEQSRAPSPTPSPTPIEAQFCNDTSLGRFLPGEIKSARSSDTSCLVVRPIASGTGGGVPVFFHCENAKANCTATVTVTFDNTTGKRPEVYTINCKP